MKKVFNLLYVTGNIEEKYGGPGTSTRLLCEALKRRGHRIDLLTFDVSLDYLSKIKSNVNIINIKSLWRGFGYGYTKYILKNFDNYDYILVNSIWGYADFLPLLVSIFKKSRQKIVLFPRGALNPYVLRKGYYKKSLYTELIQSPLIKYSRPLWGALTPNEKQEIVNLFPYINKYDIGVFPNGVIIPDLSKDLVANVRKKYDMDKYEYVFTYIGRFHPKKNIENTLKAFLSFNKNKNNLFLLFGPSNTLYKTLRKNYESEYIKFKGYIKGDEKFAVLNNSDVFVLVSYSEGLPMAVLEAIGSGCKLVISKECNVEDIDKLNIGIYANQSVKDIKKSFDRIISLPKYDNRNILLERYNWDKIAESIEKFLLRRRK